MVVAPRFDDKFYSEVFRNIVSEKIYKRFISNNSPNSKILKLGLSNLSFHLEYNQMIVDVVDIEYL